MMVTADILMEEYSDYANPKCKISRLVKEGKYTRIIRGLYETDPKTPGYLLHGFNSPSYLSFEYALSKHGIIPESVFCYTCATTGKDKRKRFETPFGTYSYRDVPKAVFRYGLELHIVGDYTYWLAGPVKAVCDQLYSLPPAKSMKELNNLIFDDQRMDYNIIFNLELKDITFLARYYRCKNVSLFEKMLGKMKNE